MAESTETAEARVKNLTVVVERLEAGFQTNFAVPREKRPAKPEDYFLETYSGIPEALSLIEEERWRDGADDVVVKDAEDLFARVWELLPQSVEHVKKTGRRLTRVHKRLLKAMHRLAARPDVRGDNGLLTHILNMADQLKIVRPQPRDAWNADGSDLRSDEEFEDTYKEFNDLQKDPDNKQQQHELYARKSWQLLKKALFALDLPVTGVFPRDEFFLNETRPAYVEYPYGTDGFFYGRGDRPGMLYIKSTLGGPLTDEERSQIRQLSPKRTEKAEKGRSDKAKGKSPAVKREPNGKGTENAGKNKGKQPAKRPSSTKHGNSKKPRTKRGGYELTLIQAHADVMDILRDTRFTGKRPSPVIEDVPRPDHGRLVTPTVEIRKPLLISYKDDLVAIANEIYKRRFGCPTEVAQLPQTPDDRKAWLETASRELGWARANVHKLMETATSAAKSKQLRLAAWKFKLVRVMYTLGLLSGSPAASPEEIREGLKGRLEDWILYEEAWNVSELVTLERRRTVSEEMWNTVAGLVDDRAINITRWQEMLKEFDDDVDGGKDGSSEGADLDESEDDEDEQKEEDDDDDDEYEEGEEEAEGDEDDDEEGEGEEEEHQDEEDEGDGNDFLEKIVAETRDLERIRYEVTLTETEIRNARTVMNYVVLPTRPDRSGYALDFKEERRQRLYYEAVARAKAR
ncbi:hypothetical protein F5Y03DRAFT_398086 [Xylaria venustula]|nr:hypothetical protein F5Y03DRAFT_398086 [Xylaria venustula]